MQNKTLSHDEPMREVPPTTTTTAGGTSREERAQAQAQRAREDDDLRADRSAWYAVKRSAAAAAQQEVQRLAGGSRPVETALDPLEMILRRHEVRIAVLEDALRRLTARATPAGGATQQPEASGEISGSAGGTK